jgi:hypothetical protein
MRERLEIDCQYEPVLNANGQPVYSEAYENAHPKQGGTGYPYCVDAGGRGPKRSRVVGKYKLAGSTKVETVKNSRFDWTDEGIRNCVAVNDAFFAAQFAETGDEKWLKMIQFKTEDGVEVRPEAHWCATRSPGPTDVRIRPCRIGSGKREGMEFYVLRRHPHHTSWKETRIRGTSNDRRDQYSHCAYRVGDRGGQDPRPYRVGQRHHGQLEAAELQVATEVDRHLRESLVCPTLVDEQAWASE